MPTEKQQQRIKAMIHEYTNNPIYLTTLTEEERQRHIESETKHILAQPDTRIKESHIVTKGETNAITR